MDGGPRRDTDVPRRRATGLEGPRQVGRASQGDRRPTASPAAANRTRAPVATTHQSRTEIQLCSRRYGDGAPSRGEAGSEHAPSAASSAQRGRNQLRGLCNLECGTPRTSYGRLLVLRHRADLPRPPRLCGEVAPLALEGPVEPGSGCCAEHRRRSRCAWLGRDVAGPPRDRQSVAADLVPSSGHGENDCPPDALRRGRRMESRSRRGTQPQPARERASASAARIRSVVAWLEPAAAAHRR